MDLNNFISTITSLELQRSLLPVKLGFLWVSLFFLIMIIFVLLKSDWLKLLLLQDLREFIFFHPFGARKIVKIWTKITKRLDTGLESEYKLAVTEADNMLDEVLKRVGYAGETLEERLNQLTSTILPNLEQVREARLIRNDVVRNPDYRLSLDQTRKTLEVYEQALRDLEVF